MNSPARCNSFRYNGRNRMSATDIFQQFVAAINAHDVAAIAALLTPDHLFMDSLGNRVSVAAAMTAGWRGYFDMCADYSIAVDRAMAEGDTVLAAGSAGGTIDGAAWRIPAAWQAVIHDGRVREWRVFADNKPVYEILARRG
jgi:ketosteroid isomerase-like protein